MRLPFDSPEIAQGFVFDSPSASSLTIRQVSGGMNLSGFIGSAISMKLEKEPIEQAGILFQYIGSLSKPVIKASLSQGYDTPQETYGAIMTQEEAEQTISVVTTENPADPEYGAKLTNKQPEGYGATLNGG